MLLLASSPTALTAFSIFFTLLVSASGQDVRTKETVYVRLDKLIAVVKHDYWVRASLRLSESATAVYKVKFFFDGLSKPCEISDWKFCDRLDNSADKFTCDCSSRVRNGTELTYRFYFFIGRVESKHQGTKFRAGLGNISRSSSFMKVVEFQQTPDVSEDGDLKMCEHTKTKLNWIFLASSLSIQRFQVSSIAWSVFGKDHELEPIATVRYDKNRM
ncbi:hypothetical protein EGW08_022912, partial [Elysia chlorotica]